MLYSLSPPTFHGLVPIEKRAVEQIFFHRSRQGSGRKRHDLSYHSHRRN